MTSGMFVPLVGDGAIVKPGTVLGYVSGDFKYDDVQAVLKLVEDDSLDWAILQAHEARFAEVGSLSGSYGALREALFEWHLYSELKSQGARELISSKQEQVRHLDGQIAEMTKGDSVLEQQVQLWTSQAERQRRLLENEVISRQEYEEILRGKLGSEGSRTTAAAEVQRLLVQRQALNQELLSLRQGRVESEVTLLNNVQVARLRLRSELTEWSHEHLLVAEIEGRVSYNDFVTGIGEHIRVETGSLVAVVAPVNARAYVGLMRVRPDGIGLVRKGQHVRIMLRNYPPQEFGSLNGTVSKISEVPLNGSYNVWVTIDPELSSSYHRTLAFMEGMAGEAEIVISRQSILEKGYNALRWRLRNL
jgi:hypothetical protein